MNFFVPPMSLRLYADDTTGYYSDASPTVLQFVVNSELSLLSSWFDQNHLLVNNDKTQELLLGPCSYNSFVLPHLEYCSPLLFGVGKVRALSSRGR